MTKKIYDFCIIGNGILGSTLAWKLSEKLKNNNIAIIGPKNKFGSASVASGAMINVFAEIEDGFQDYKPLVKRFELGYRALKLWKSHHKEIQDKSGKKIQIKWGTHILNSSNGTQSEDSTFLYLQKILKNKNYKSKYELNIDPKNIEGVKTQHRERPIRSLKVEDGIVHSGELLNAIDIILNKFNQLDIFDNEAIKILVDKKNIHKIYLKDKSVLSSKNIILANGAYAQNLIKDNKDLTQNIPELFYGGGAGIDLIFNNYSNKFRKANFAEPKNAIRTLDRGNACGLHWLPFRGGEYYLGASSAIFTIPESNVRAASISYLLGDASKQFSPIIGRSNIKEIKFGFRPVSADIFPLIGETHIKGIWYLNGTKRDGLTMSPYIINELVKLLINGKSMLPKIFYPSRKLISYYNKEKAIIKAIRSISSKEHTHGMTLTDGGNYEEYYDRLKDEFLKVYQKHNIKSFGIHPELLPLYKNNLIKSKRSIK